MNSTVFFLIFPGSIFVEICGVLTAVFFSVALAMFLCNRKLKQKNQQIQARINELQDHAHELQLMLECIASLGKISYYIGNLSSKMLKNNYNENCSMPLAESFMTDMLPADHEHFRENCRKILNEEIDHFQENYTLLINGELKRHIDSARLINLPKSGEKKLLLASMDVSELEIQSRELAATDSILQAIFDNLPGHIFIKNISSDFSYIRCSPAYSGLLQLRPADLVGKNDFDLFPRELAQLIRNCDIEISRTHGIADKRWFFTTPDGKEHAIRFIARWLMRADGSEWILGFGVDVTRQEHIAGKLRRRNKELRLLLAQSAAEIMLLDKNLKFACSFPAMRKYFPDVEEVDSSTITCRSICSCRCGDTDECAAVQALKDGRIHFCRHACLAGGILQIKPLTGEDDQINYLAVSAVAPETVQEEESV